MKKLEDLITLSIIIIGLSIHLFVIHSKLLLHLNPDRIIELIEYKFNFDLFNLGYRVSTVSAIIFSLMTAYVLTKFVKYYKLFIIVTISFALLDGIGTTIYYNVNIVKNLFITLGSIYYGVYTALLIVAIGMYRHLNYKDQKLREDIDRGIGENGVVQLREKLNITMNNYDKNLSLDEKVVRLYLEGYMSQEKIAKELSTSQATVSRAISKYKANIEE